MFNKPIIRKIIIAMSGQKSFDNFVLVIDVILWFVFTAVSAAYTKIYLNNTADVFTFTLITLFVGFLFSLINKSFTEIKRYFSTYALLSLFNVASLFLTNISLNGNSVSFIYMIKVIS